ncbi:MAG: hypothetical protein ACM30G_18535 [Micromonosporaceae bacterium]
MDRNDRMLGGRGNPEVDRLIAVDQTSSLRRPLESVIHVAEHD